ncbi:DUF4178 domain-containing protein [Clostridium cylindrosporum]|uniref:DUF4178 domain-containing protein n=1 Tax=Clostridium cylindrosporum DSM 605 TaxID=1121307 RepID=A0A0J8DGH2_CLOCY|nr:DUF4178 domain-containing protein [Clostridium cylindrosporum]KMT23263.1 hypothetical protein CLCY_6c01440 [Clostridium cylindrosporum DSM 605]
MVKGDISLDIGSSIRISGVRYKVEGCILFEDSDGTSWAEYKIKSRSFQTLWLSVDNINDEYAVYSEESYSEEFIEKNINDKGYEKLESNSAIVLDYEGNVDVDVGEKVFYIEYENEVEELLISIEEWNGEKEYSKGYYINKNNIEKLDESNSNDTSTLYWVDKIKGHKLNKVILGAFVLVIILITVFYGTSNPNNSLSTRIALIDNFQYETSITSDLDKDIKADVYSTEKTIEEAAMQIIDELQGSIEDVQENEEDGAVAIITSDEIAIVYKGEDSKTRIQVSSREYAYASRNTLYMGSDISSHYYRSYYYTKGYTKDIRRYKNLRNSYSDYKGAKITPSNSNKYKTYSDSIRQSSVNSRSSSGDGISSGK